MHRRFFAAVIIFCSFFQGILQGQNVKTLESSKGNRKIFILQNEYITCKVIIRENQLEGDSLIGNPLWLRSNGSAPFALYK